MMTMTTTMTMITCNLALTPVTCILGFESVVLRINMHARYFHVVFQKEQYLMSKYAYHTFRLSCCVRFSLIGLVMVSHHPLSVKNKVVIRAFNCWYFGNYVLRLFFFNCSFPPHHQQKIAVGKTGSCCSLLLTIIVTCSVFTHLDHSMISGVKPLLWAILSDC